MTKPTAPDAAGPAPSSLAAFEEGRWFNVGGEPGREPEIEEKLAEMLLDGAVFVSGQLDTLCVNCNDLFYWACADAEDLAIDQIETFWTEWKAGRMEEWVCLRRGMRPQKPYIDLLKKRGEWTAKLESLPVRTDA